jgi:polar amino acid transport system substrate-binding protein
VSVRAIPRRLLTFAAFLGAIAVLVSACGSKEGAAGSSFHPAQPGVLKVATAFLPAPGFWEGTPPTKGFEAALAADLAHRLGLDRVEVVQVPFADIVSGKLGGADIALSQTTPTKEREQKVDFTTPYLISPPGVLARQGADARDENGLKKLHWVISSASTLTPIVKDRIRPNSDPIVTVDRAQALDVLRVGRADALLLDLPVALGLAREEPALFHVIGQLSGQEGLAAILPNGSPNREVVDSAIRHFQANGTIGKLVDRWLGRSVEDVPLIRTEQ